MNRPVRITQQTVERNVRQQRVLDDQRMQLQHFANENAKLLGTANSLVKIENKRSQTQRQLCDTELTFEEKFKDSEAQRRMKERLLKQNEAMASALDREIAEEERKAREVQRICEEAPELKELEKALKIAYLNKELAAQQQERVLLQSLEKERMQAIEDKMEFDRQMALKSDDDKSGAKRKMYEDQRQVLLAQIAEKEAALLDAQRQTEVDKATVDEIVRRINEEDILEMQRRREMQESTRKMMQDYAEQRRQEIADKRAAEKAEEDAINSYNRALDARGEGVAAKKQAKKDEEDRIFKKIVEETERKRREEEEFNNLRDMLWEEELEAQRAADAKERRDRVIRMKQEMMDANDRMLLQKKEIQKLESEREARLLSSMHRKFKEDEAREKAEEDARIASKHHHMRLVDQQRRQRREMFDQERQEEALHNRDAAEREEYRKMVVREARRRLLEEHSAKLKGFLPAKLVNKDI